VDPATRQSHAGLLSKSTCGKQFCFFWCGGERVYRMRPCRDKLQFWLCRKRLCSARKGRTHWSPRILSSSARGSRIWTVDFGGRFRNYQGVCSPPCWGFPLLPVTKIATVVVRLQSLAFDRCPFLRQSFTFAGRAFALNIAMGGVMHGSALEVGIAHPFLHSRSGLAWGPAGG
jgi:hypothetical protein